MPNDMPHNFKFSYDQHARTCAPDDFLGQTLRTVKGVPVTEEQIQMIVEAMQAMLRMTPDDTLLELACGNGALSHFLFDSCLAFLGVDVSDYLISVAKKNFELLPNYRFAVSGAAEYVQSEPHPEQFSRVLCYAGFQFFSVHEAAVILQSIFSRFINVQRIYIGNLPDKDRAACFFKERQYSEEELSDNTTAIGLWRTQNEFEQLAREGGWKVTFSTMPDRFHASHYRYDALLSR